MMPNVFFLALGWAFLIDGQPSAGIVCFFGHLYVLIRDWNK